MLILCLYMMYSNYAYIMFVCDVQQLLILCLYMMYSNYAYIMFVYDVQQLCLYYVCM